MKNLYQKIIRFFTTQTIPSQKVKVDFDFVSMKEQEKRIKQLIPIPKEMKISEQVLLFAGTLLPNEKIIVSPEDFKKIVACKDNYGYIVHWDREYRIAQFQLETELINNFPRAELGETRTNRNFELK